MLDAGSLILSNSGTVCVPKILSVKGCIHDGFVTFPTLHDQISKDFLYHWFDFIRPKVIQANKQGITQVNLNTDIVRELDVPVPPFNEQCRIVAKIEELLSDLDAGIAVLKRAKANLKRYRAAVLKAGVEGKLTAEWRAKHPKTEPSSKLLERILAERRRKWEGDQLAKFAETDKEPPKNWKSKYSEPTSFETTGLLELPGDWCWTSVDHLIVEPTCNGISVKGSDEPPGVPALRLNSMTDDGFDYEQRRYIPISGSLANELKIEEGDFFISRGNGSLHLVGRGVLAQTPPDVVVFPDTMIRVRFCNSKFLRQFIRIVWTSRLVRRQIEKKARTTAGIYKISQRDVEQFLIPLPPLAEQQQIVVEVEQRLSVIAVAEQQIEASLLRAGRLRQSVLKRAFEGKLVLQDPKDEPASVLLEQHKKTLDQRAVPDVPKKPLQGASKRQRAT